MQFVANGPDIPDALLQAHEEGRVVFFCGAGISYPAGLPSFKGLVDKIYSLLGTTFKPIERVAYSRKQFDATLDLLERRIPGQRFALRKELEKALQPKLKGKGATDTHKALLQLARNREGVLRLVTTNFDRIFERVADLSKLSVNSYAAPMLPIPKNSRWNGLVYLHGLLPESADESELNRLVLTSGDFGLAYLTERWAARFVSELFCNYVVCFVGYSIDDPVLRYMMDALAADRVLGEVTPTAFALCDYRPGQENSKTIEWEAKGVVPILYEVPAGTRNHSALHGTLKMWAETYRDGILGKERIVVDYAMVRPSVSTRQDDYVGRMLWALSDESGLPAKRFAEFNPVPSLDWLYAFSEERYLHCDLERFGVHPYAKLDNKLAFSFICRPAPYNRAPLMSLVSGGVADSQLDKVMYQIARWLVRYLNDPALILWLAPRGGMLHNQLIFLIEQALDRYFRLEQEGKTDELEEIRINAPNAIPTTLMRKLWCLLLSGRVKSLFCDLDLYGWKDRLKRDGMTTSLRMELRELLAPKIMLRKPFRWSENDGESDIPDCLEKIVDWELVLKHDQIYPLIKELADVSSWCDALPILFDDFQQLLHDTLDLLRELGAANDREDDSNWNLPSISSHSQNRSFQNWVILIELLRDAWLSVRKTDSIRASRIAQRWFTLPYPTFKRLALFAASYDGCISADQWVDWLLCDGSWLLWSVDTKREMLRLLVLQGDHLTSDLREKLESAIFLGPPRTMYRDDIETERWELLVSDAVWLRLVKLMSDEVPLSLAVQAKLSEIAPDSSDWKTARTSERNEFSRWMSGTGDPDYEKHRDINHASNNRYELVSWLKLEPPSGYSFYEDNWCEMCSTRFFYCAFALCDLAKEGQWPVRRWNEALQVWREEGRIVRSWRFLAPLIQTMPDQYLQEILHSVTRWLEAVSMSIDRHEAIFLDLCRRVLDLPCQDDLNTNQSIVTRAINHPAGQVTQALLNLCFKQAPNDNDKLHGDLEPLFTLLCGTNKDHIRHGQVLLASQLTGLFRIDQAWTETHLLPLFDWSANPVEAQAVWNGFLWSPRLYSPLLIAFKVQFLATAHHYTELGEHGRHYATLLTYAALEQVETYTFQDFRDAIGALSEEGLHESLQALVEALKGAGEQREEYWKNRIQLFWQHIWPKQRKFASNRIIESLAYLIIETRGEFSSALAAIFFWLGPVDHPLSFVHRFHNSGLAKRFPDDSLHFLIATLSDKLWLPRELRQCLDDIAQAEPKLSKDLRYKRLDESARRCGI